MSSSSRSRRPTARAGTTGRSFSCATRALPRAARRPPRGPRRAAALPDERRGRLPRPALPRAALPGDRRRSRGWTSAARSPCCGPPTRGAASTGAGGSRWLLDPVLLDSALQVQVIWARLNWDVTLLPAEIGGHRVMLPAAQRPAPDGEPIRHELRRAARQPGAALPMRPSLPRSRTAACWRRSKASSESGARRSTGWPGRGHDAARRVRAHRRGRHHRDGLPLPGRARRGRLLAQHPRQGRRHLRPARRRPGTRTSTTTRSSRTPTPPTASAAATSARLLRSTRSPTACPRSSVGGEPDQWLALADRAGGARPTPARSSFPGTSASGPRSCSARAPT